MLTEPASLDRRPGALSSVPSPTVSCAHMLGKTRFLNTKIQEAKETPWIRAFHFLGEPAATYHVGRGNPAQIAAVYLGHHNPGQPQASARLGLKTIHCTFSAAHRPRERCASCRLKVRKEEYQTAKEREHHVVFSFFWDPAATYLSGPSPAKYCRRIRA